MNLTTTSYAILGHLALRDWTMYDLAQQMRSNVHFFFSRAESQVYAEPKRLVACGLASASRQMTGRRARTLYAITDAGRRELDRWLAEPEAAKGPDLEFEALLRVFLSPLGRPEHLVGALEQVRDNLSEMFEAAEQVGGAYRGGTAAFQHHVLTRSMVYDFLVSFAELADDWAERSAARARRWPDQTEAERMDEAMRIFSEKPGPSRRRD
ncbi:PadR family transcriptional regulator [Aquibium microcysteis]|uniref:PadR family transcriptional regulator n=1 Tax=Aquibium microcysteis TaxID=675281 RepID=UPI00165D0B26|nr:PadR family transcriptional regulator [Aquibium microcysteis]